MNDPLHIIINGQRLGTLANLTLYLHDAVVYYLDKVEEDWRVFASAPWLAFVAQLKLDALPLFIPEGS